MPWASQSFEHDSQWTDPQYHFAISLGITRTKWLFMRDAMDSSLNLWNAFNGMDVAWLAPAVLCVALLRRLRCAGPKRWRPALFVWGFFAASFALGLAPFYVSDFRDAGYRMLLGPAQLVALALIWAVEELLGFHDRDDLPGWARFLLPSLAVLLASVAFVTMLTGVREARAEVSCLEGVLSTAPAGTEVLLLNRLWGGSRLRFEFGWRISEQGLLDEFATQVVGGVSNRQGIELGPGSRGLPTAREASEDEALRSNADSSSAAFLSLPPHACVCRPARICGRFSAAP